MICFILAFVSMLLFAACEISPGDNKIDSQKPPQTVTDSEESVDTQEEQADEKEPVGDIVENDDISRPDGWSKATHGKKAEPNYDVVFGDSAVPRMDIKILPSDWQAVMDDTAEDYGPFGGGGGRCGTQHRYIW